MNNRRNPSLSPANFARAMLMALFALSAGNVSAAGYARIEVPAQDGEPAIRAMVWSPCVDAPATAQIGPVAIQGVPDCAIEGDALPLIVVSHGFGGSMLGHYDTATALADASFVVVSFNHPGDSFDDDSTALSLGIFESRPRDASRVISYMLERWPQREKLNAKAVGVFGFSRGGYTALALAGAVPSITASVARHCKGRESQTAALCRQLRRDDARLAPRPDDRIGAVVVVDPLNLFDTNGLKQVNVPVQLWASEQGGDGVGLSDVEAIREGLQRSPEYHVARGAGHFAYLAPCSPALAESDPAICRDPPGFDRIAWHRSMNAAIVAFFEQHLPGRR